MAIFWRIPCKNWDIRSSVDPAARGGVKGLIQLIRTVRDGSDAIITVDGPRGPRWEVKPGVALLALKSGAHIVTVGARAKSKILFSKSWSQTFLPMPFTRLVIGYGAESIPPPENDSPEAISACLEKIHESLAGLMKSWSKIFTGLCDQNRLFQLECNGNGQIHVHWFIVQKRRLVPPLLDGIKRRLVE